MDQTVSLNHFQSSGIGGGFSPIPTAEPGKGQDHDTPQPLAPGQEAVAHGGKQLLLGLAFVSKVSREMVIDEGDVFCHLMFEGIIHPRTPFP